MEDPGRGGERFADVGEHAVGVDLAVGGAAKPDRRNGRESADGDDSDADGPGDRPAEGGEASLQPAPSAATAPFNSAVSTAGSGTDMLTRSSGGPSGNFVVDHPHFVGRIGQQGRNHDAHRTAMSHFLGDQSQNCDGNVNFRTELPKEVAITHYRGFGLS